MAFKKETGWRHLLKATGYSLAGIKIAWQTSAAFRLESGLCAVLVPTAFWLGTTAVQRGILIGACLSVLVTELLNSAIEALVDRIGPEFHTLSGQAKDLGSAAVFANLILTGIIWGLIIYERF